MKSGGVIYFWCCCKLWSTYHYRQCCTSSAHFYDPFISSSLFCWFLCSPVPPERKFVSWRDPVNLETEFRIKLPYKVERSTIDHSNLNIPLTDWRTFVVIAIACDGHGRFLPAHQCTTGWCPAETKDLISWRFSADARNRSMMNHVSTRSQEKSKAAIHLMLRVVLPEQTGDNSMWTILLCNIHTTY